mmetsp:Transcript_42911/g.98487  ORF Transcript_42911/g.98487 Transcript_42911/m.98487 type:complete len:315 (+) Transcript_42911:1075-2019(+)
MMTLRLSKYMAAPVPPGIPVNTQMQAMDTRNSSRKIHPSKKPIPTLTPAAETSTPSTLEGSNRLARQAAGGVPNSTNAPNVPTTAAIPMETWSRENSKACCMKNGIIMTIVAIGAAIRCSDRHSQRKQGTARKASQQARHSDGGFSVVCVSRVFLWSIAHGASSSQRAAVPNPKAKKMCLWEALPALPCDRAIGPSTPAPSKVPIAFATPRNINTTTRSSCVGKSSDTAAPLAHANIEKAVAVMNRLHPNQIATPTGDKLSGPTKNETQLTIPTGIVNSVNGARRPQDWTFLNKATLKKPSSLSRPSTGPFHTS